MERSALAVGCWACHPERIRGAAHGIRPAQIMALAIIATLFVIPGIAHAFDVPPNDGFVTDTVPLLTAAEQQELETTLSQYRDQTSNEIAILITPNLQGEQIADVAVEVGRKWGVGTKEHSNGVLMVISYEDRHIFIATGYGLEGAVPDIVAAGIAETEMAPHFRDGKYAEGIKAGIDALQKHIGGEYNADRYAAQEGPSFPPFLIFFLFIGFEIIVSMFGRTKSWWLGGVVGGGIGALLAAIWAWWWSIPVLVAIGLVIDYIASKSAGKPGRRGGGYWMGGGGFGGGGGGGFGGFGGGSFGGGGGGAKW